MSFDIFVQRYFDGQPVAIAHSDVDAVFGAYVVERDPEHEYVHLEWGDDEADVYGIDDSDAYDALMVSDFTAGIYVLLHELMTRAGAVVMPEGGAALLADATLSAGLPADVREDAQVIVDAAELAAVLEARGF